VSAKLSQQEAIMEKDKQPPVSKDGAPKPKEPEWIRGTATPEKKG
jgi:hypothetical protein